MRVYGAITFYLEHESEINDYLVCQSERWADLRSKHALPEALREKIEAGKRATEAHHK